MSVLTESTLRAKLKNLEIKEFEIEKGVIITPSARQYLQDKNIIDPSRLVSCGFGQFRPISSFDTRESRAKNRRVEIIITKSDGVVKSLDEYYKEVYGIDTAKS
ncbi:hypothetical protein SDC9_77651 [bioreactor metagenome]|uniref:OmpA-like domain-containing protein n=1 Tax=bioreactor metagenome TaxID=1076179 RepID=A0A644YT13_9ZZZZ